MITPRDYYSQYLSYGDSGLHMQTCGITSIAMVLSSLGKFDRWTNPQRNLESFLQWIISRHKNNGEVVKKPVRLHGETIWVTVGMAKQVKPEAKDKVVTESGEYYPTFTYAVGYDHRFSRDLFAEHGVQAELRENYSFAQLKADMQSGKLKYFLASIHSLRQRERHVVIVQKIATDEQGEYVEFVDPAEVQYDYAVKTLDAAFFKLIYNGYGTAVYA